MEDEDDDFELVPTQVAGPSQVQAHDEQHLRQLPALQAAARADAERKRCAVCALDVTAWGVMQRAVHVNACLDAISLREHFACPSCDRDLTDYNEQRRAAHVNLCLDRMAGGQSTSPPSAPAPPAASASAPSPGDAVGGQDPRGRGPNSTTTAEEDIYHCKICGQDLSSRGLDVRIRHVKQCGRRLGVRPGDLVVAQADRTPLDLLTDAKADSETVDAAASVDSSGRDAFALMMTRAASGSTPAPPRGGELGGSSVFDVMMKSARTAAVTGVAKRQRGGQGGWQGGWQGGGGGRFNRVGGAGSARRRTRWCPEFKRIKGTSPPFIVDGFPFASKELSSTYFLTHFHSDHYGGISKGFDCGVIYCNEVTARLVQQELGVASKFVHAVPMDRPVTVAGVEVTFMDANHCPGAAILLFRFKDGRAYLHTGDFRFDRSMLAYPPLRPFVPSTEDGAAPSTRLDGVYLDTTYANPKYTFPTQQAVISHALALMDRHLQRSDGGQPPEPDRKTLFLFGSYSLGKERLFMEVATKFQRKVCVSAAKMRVISTFGWPERQLRLLTTEAGATNLHVVPMQNLQMEQLTALLDKHRLRFHRIVAFRPTGWTFSGGSGMSTSKSDPSGRIRVYGVPYSEHSSFVELADCVRTLNPREIIPTVNCSSEQQVRRQVGALRQAAFSILPSLFQPQQESQLS